MMNLMSIWILLKSVIYCFVSVDAAGSWLLRPRERSLEATRSTTAFGIYSCPLDLSGKKCNKRGWLPYAPYGIKHTYLKIGSTCYDWGDWNYPRHVACSSGEISCCSDDGTLRYSGNTNCADRVSEFEAAWDASGDEYSLWSWNCQTYVDAMKDFLNNCYSNAGDAIP